MTPLGIVNYKQKMCECYCKTSLHGPLGLATILIGSSAPTDPWNITTIYNKGLVDIKALCDLPEIYDPETGKYKFYCSGVYRITLAYNASIKNVLLCRTCLE